MKKRDHKKILAKQDKKNAAILKMFTDKVNNFLEPVNILTRSLCDENAVLLTRKNGEFVGYIIGDAMLEMIIKQNRLNLLKELHSKNLAEIFSKSMVSDFDMQDKYVNELGKSARIEVGEGVPPEVADGFRRALGQ
jgi:hypothetical protein